MAPVGDARKIEINHVASSCTQDANKHPVKRQPKNLPVTGRRAHSGARLVLLWFDASKLFLFNNA